MPGVVEKMVEADEANEACASTSEDLVEVLEEHSCNKWLGGIYQEVLALTLPNPSLPLLSSFLSLSLLFYRELETTRLTFVEVVHGARIVFVVIVAE